MPKSDNEVKELMDNLDFNSKEVDFVDGVEYAKTNSNAETARNQINSMTDDEFLAMVL